MCGQDSTALIMRRYPRERISIHAPQTLVTGTPRKIRHMPTIFTLCGPTYGRLTSLGSAEGSTPLISGRLLNLQSWLFDELIAMAGLTPVLLAQ